MLAKLLDCDSEKIDAAFRWSGLARDKWTERDDYREATIRKAIERIQSKEPVEKKEVGKSLVVESACEVQTKKVQWLWSKRFPLGKLTLFVGNPDNGKSLVTGDVAAAVTTGRDWIDSKNEIPPSDVLMLIGEDDVDDTTVPRLQAAGADLSKIYFLKSVVMTNGTGHTQTEREVQLDADLAEIKRILESHPNIRLIVVDPVSNYLGRTKMVSEQDVRAVLIPLKNLAATMNVAIIGVMHLNKKVDLSAINRIGGAMAFVGVARAARLFARDPENPDTLHMLRVKCNIAKRSGGLIYKTEPKLVEVGGSLESYPFVQWIGETDKTADDVLEPKGQGKGRPSEERTKAADWLRDFLKGGALPCGRIEDQGKGHHGFSKKTLQRAKEEIGVCSFQKGRKWYWQLPEATAATRKLSRNGVRGDQTARDFRRNLASSKRTSSPG